VFASADVRQEGKAPEGMLADNPAVSFAKQNWGLKYRDHGLCPWGSIKGKVMSNKRVLIIDDDKEFVEELNETLGLSGYDVVSISDSVSAVEVASRTKPDVILLDLKMPEKNGIQIAEEVRQVTELSHVPIIVMTAFFKDEHIQIFSSYGVSRYLRKPFNPLDVISQIEFVLR